ncbi:MAG TPA: pyrroline-5-carboxylate reductase [Lachnoclostridium phytofermentans]|uniref:Pyrroline-5-carboxylate reductase n=1 Tax=Lachnoclostridium phytofermentans TaxID=66219 RepID=A0A3D2XA39_9FIRM|nr:pyrroline-5-carboxylate reductase [Lachnoclostridium sp.]HCL03846.1 pyrroline-5-carboxylate reductase [Lachnoclostridium phytofermentans]
MKLGFIGCGNMATAMISGMINNHIVEATDIIASDASSQALKNAEEKLGILTTSDNLAVATGVDVLFLSVKPQYYETVIKEISQDIRKSTIIVTIAAGQSLKRVESLFERTLKLIRTMPNTPALVSEGITAVCRNDQVTEEEFALVMNLLRGFGIAEEVSEHLMDAVVAVSGSSPAYVFILIEAMADAAVAEGMPRDKAYRFAAQAVLGSAKMVLETGKHPGALKDMVCSPGGTTIDAVQSLEKTGFRSSIMEAMKVCAEKSRKLS